MKAVQNLLSHTKVQSLIDLFEYSIEPVIITDADWDVGLRIIYVNRELCRMTGYGRKELIGKSPKIFQGKKSNLRTLKHLKTELLAGKNFFGQSINYRKDNSSYIVKWSISPLKDENDVILGYISFQKTIEQVIQIAHEKLLNSIVNTSQNLILVTDLEGYIIYVNDACNEKLGYLKDELIGKHSRILKSGMHSAQFYTQMWNNIIEHGTFSDIFVSRKKDGTFFYDKKNITTIRDTDGNPIYYVSTSTDITEEMTLQKSLESQVYIDSLTQIYNKKKYEEVILEQIKAFQKDKKIFSLIVIDIDHFKKINDSYGHDTGDAILMQFSKIIQHNIRSDDLLFRWGGEEFALIIPKDKEETHKLAEKLRRLIASADFQSIHVTASFGISEIGENKDQKILFKEADTALYRAKSNGRNKVKIF